MFRKANMDKTLQKCLKFSHCPKSIRKQIRPSCRKTFRPHFVFAWLRKATKFRDSSEYSQCVQNVLAKSCLPSQIYIQTKNFLLSAERPRYELSATVLRRICKQIVIFRKVTTCFNFKDMFRCCQHHCQLHNI